VSFLSAVNRIQYRGDLLFHPDGHDMDPVGKGPEVPYRFGADPDAFFQRIGSVVDTAGDRLRDVDPGQVSRNWRNFGDLISVTPGKTLTVRCLVRSWNFRYCPVSKIVCVWKKLAPACAFFSIMSICSSAGSDVGFTTAPRQNFGLPRSDFPARSFPDSSVLAAVSSCTGSRS
jgi:hypothetical protein